MTHRARSSDHSTPARRRHLSWRRCHLRCVGCGAGRALRVRSELRTVPATPGRRAAGGPGWIYEIKHDGFRILAHRRGRGVRLFTRNGNDFTDRFPLIAEAIEALPVKSCVVDGEAIVCDGDGLAVFDLIRCTGATRAVALRLRPDRGEWRGHPARADRGPQAPARRSAAAHARRHRPQSSITSGDGATIFRHACALGCEGIVSKRLGSPYRAGRSAHWLKIKNPEAPAVKREAEEEWR